MGQCEGLHTETNFFSLLGEGGQPQVIGMSKAFVKETEDEPELMIEAPAIPAGVKNYMTPQGHRRMQDELRRLLREERPKVVEVVAWAAGNGDRSENGDYIYGKKRLREIDRRIRFLSKRLESAEVVDPHRQKNRDQEGQVSWISPIARALIKAHEGDVVELRTPAGTEPIEIVEIRYRSAEPD